MKVNLEGRVARLERENRWLRLGGLTAALLLGGAVLLGQAAPEEIPEVMKARRFEVVDKNGEFRAGLGASVDGGTMVFADKTGAFRADLDFAQDGAVVLSLRNEKGKTRTSFFVGNNKPGLVLYDDAGKVRAMLSLGGNGSPGLRFFDGTGKKTWGAP